MIYAVERQTGQHDDGDSGDYSVQAPQSPDWAALIERLLRLIDRKERETGPTETWAMLGICKPLARFLQEDLPRLNDGELQNLAARATVRVSDIQSQAAGRAAFRTGDWRVLLYCLTGSRTLLEAISRAEELFLVIDGRLGDLSLIKKDGSARLLLSGSRCGDEELDFIVTYHGYRLFHTMLGWLIGRPLTGRLNLDFPDRCRVYADTSGISFNLSLGAKRSELIFPSALLDQPIIRTMEDCISVGSVRHLLGPRLTHDAAEVSRRVQALLRLHLRDQSHLLSLDELARELAMGRMTLRRRLQAANTSYNQLRDDIRQELATYLLKNEKLSIDEVTERLDFCDADAFRRAFRNWTGMAPTQYRQRILNSSGLEIPS